MDVALTHFGTLPDGQEISKITLQSDDMTVGILTFGATLQSVVHACAPRNLTLGFNTIAPYLETGHFAGGIIGPVANRIAGAQASLGGSNHRFEANDTGNTLHSGAASWHLKNWHIADQGPGFVTLSLRSTAGDGGFRAAYHVTATYQLIGPHLTLAIIARADAATWIAPAQHSYWNLSGADTIDEHTLSVAADHYLATDAQGIPTHRAPVKGTSFDLRRASPIAQRRLDHNFCLSDTRRTLTPAATLRSPEGLSLDIATTDVGLQVYDGGFLDVAGHGPRSFIALEAQGWPNAMNRPDFPNTRLEPRQIFHQITRWTITP
ncbi:aldose epimerase family protein [Nereida sp. MMG025]|uniref:aldose epimerase family protein n=1 Tax=Nereida sp. MMG025 TaxID=2909981 RepID=UPI001F3AF3AC|nr:aldose epimerase family protein [Nereida sp. MMG025]MCF6445810.1 galactose mutarotase [Nereida sp. MMG025]